MPSRRMRIRLAVFVMSAAVLCACNFSAAIAPTAAAPSAPVAALTMVATQIQVNQSSAGAAGNGTISWPSEMPADVPQFSYGTITASSNNVMGHIQATFRNVPADAYDKYQSDLKNAGWTITNATQSADGFEIDAAKAPRTVVALFIASKSGGFKGAVTYTANSGQ
ncbi:MAG: hypothetical protein ABSG98_12620 [Anaerolineales bacterium]